MNKPTRILILITLALLTIACSDTDATDGVVWLKVAENDPWREIHARASFDVLELITVVYYGDVIEQFGGFHRLRAGEQGYKNVGSFKRELFGITGVKIVIEGRETQCTVEGGNVEAGDLFYTCDIGESSPVPEPNENRIVWLKVTENDPWREIHARASFDVLELITVVYYGDVIEQFGGFHRLRAGERGFKRVGSFKWDLADITDTKVIIEEIETECGLESGDAESGELTYVCDILDE